MHTKNTLNSRLYWDAGYHFVVVSGSMQKKRMIFLHK